MASDFNMMIRCPREDVIDYLLHCVDTVDSCGLRLDQMTWHFDRHDQHTAELRYSLEFKGSRHRMSQWMEHAMDWRIV